MRCLGCHIIPESIKEKDGRKVPSFFLAKRGFLVVVIILKFWGSIGAEIKNR